VRPSVSVILPFNGVAAELVQVLGRLDQLELRDTDAVVVVDNRSNSNLDRVDDPRVITAPAQQSAYYARNRGVEASSGEWLVFLDGDVFPRRDLIDRYFEGPPDDGVGVLAGTITDEEPETDNWVQRYSFLCRMLDQGNSLKLGRGFAKTANCAVRRAAFDAVGGFAEGIRSAGDADLCYRIIGAGWHLESRSDAVAVHRGRPSLSGMLGQRARHGSGMDWLNGRYPGLAPRRSLLVLTRQAAYGFVAGLISLVRGERDAAIMRILHPLATLASEVGRYVPNRPWAEILSASRLRS
jgi:GT2 family glycosyltransferase